MVEMLRIMDVFVADLW